VKIIFTLILSTVLLFSCKGKKIITEFESFNPTLDKPYTQDLKHYNDALSRWKKNSSEYVEHFPKKLDSNITYKLFYFPGLLQAGSYFELMIKFPDQQSALMYFYENSKNYKVEKNDIKVLKSSMYCYNESFTTNPKFKLENIDIIRMIHPIWCASQGDRKIGGIRSEMYIDKSKKIIFCVAADES